MSAGLLSWPRLLRPAGDELALPVGCRLADERGAGRKCFLLLEGSAVAEADGRPIATFSAGSFVGSLDDRGRPAPLRGMTVRVITPSRAVVLDARRLAALLDADRVLAAAWLRHKPADRPARSWLPRQVERRDVAESHRRADGRPGAGVAVTHYRRARVAGRV